MSANQDFRPDEFPAELKSIEAALGALVPATSRVDRDRLMYAAGAASAAAPASQRFVRLSAFWPLATAAMLLVSLGLVALLAFRSPLERVVYVDRPAIHQEPNAVPSLAAATIDSEFRISRDQSSADASYLVLRERVLRLGVNALDAPQHEAGGSPPSDSRNRSLLHQLLGS